MFAQTKKAPGNRITNFFRVTGLGLKVTQVKDEMDDDEDDGCDSVCDVAW